MLYIYIYIYLIIHIFSEKKKSFERLKNPIFNSLSFELLVVWRISPSKQDSR